MELPSLNSNPYINKDEQGNAVAPNTSLLSNFNTKHFIIGAAIGAVGAYLLTNEKAQKALFKTVAKGAQAFQAGIEEMKERFEDAKAELAVEQE